MLLKCTLNNLENIVLAADWNCNLMDNQDIMKGLRECNLKVLNFNSRWTYNNGHHNQKIDFFAISNSLINSEVNTEIVPL